MFGDDAQVITDLVEVKTADRLKPGSYIFALIALDKNAEILLSQLSDRMFLWDGGPASLWPPRFAWKGARPIIQENVNTVLQPLGLVAYLPKTSSLDPRKPPAGSNYRQRKWWSSDRKALLFWADVKTLGSSPTGLGQAWQKIVSVFTATVPIKLSGTPVSQGPLKIGFKVFQTRGQAVQSVPTQPIKPVTPTTPVVVSGGAKQQPIQVTVNVPPQNQGGGATGFRMPDGKTETPKPSQVAVDGWTNPWLWGAAALGVFGLTFLTKQVRGGLREIGSGVRSTYDEARSGTDSLGADPTIPQGRRRRA